MDWLSMYHILFVKLYSECFVQKVTMRNGIESFAQIKKDYFQQLEKDPFLWPRVKRRQEHIGCGLVFTELCQIKGIDSL